ncbi:MAG: OmpP1/FadL family transporter [Steroidobacteraceae bacterium]
MNSGSKFLHLSVLAALSGTALLAVQSAGASGFSIAEQSASGLGNAYAGAAAVAEDASTLFFNSAGLTQLTRPSLVMTGAAIQIKSEFKNNGSVAATGQALGTNGGDAGGTILVPALYVAVPLSDTVTGGLAVNAPFGLKTEYNDDFIGRFQGIVSDVKTTNINTALAFKLNNVVSLGVGANYQTIDAKLTKNINYTAAIASNTGGALVLPGLQGGVEIKGNDSAWGYDVGLLFNFNDRTHVGLSYRSAIKYNVAGNAAFSPPTTTNATGQAIINAASASTLANGPVTLAIKLPASARLAATQKLGNSVELLGEVSWTQWSSVPELRINRTNGVTLSNTPEQWDDTMRYALGANFQLNDAVKLRVGAAKDEAPVPDSTRTPRLPDNDRTWLTAGAQVKVTNNINMDVAYANIKAKDAALNQNDGSTAANGLLKGTQKTSINILSLQATVSF